MPKKTFNKSRRANVSPDVAIKELLENFPGTAIAAFDHDKTAGVYRAKLVVAEFPPKDDGDEDSDDVPVAEPEEDSNPDAEADEAGDHSEPDGDEMPDFGGDEGGDDKGGKKPKKKSENEQIIDLLQQLVDAVSGGGSLSAEAAPLDGPAGPGALDLPDVGAPPAGGDMPPKKAPLPPPVEKKQPFGGPSFAHVASNEVIKIARRDASEVNNAGLMAEIASEFPDHKIAQIKRSGSDVVNGLSVDIAQNNIAVVTLVKK